MADSRKTRESDGWTTRGNRAVWTHLSGAKIYLDPSGMWVALGPEGKRVGVFVNQKTAFERAAK
jgi:hypothetical protein